jgi:hypothetical protein
MFSFAACGVAEKEEVKETKGKLVGVCARENESKLYAISENMMGAF